MEDIRTELAKVQAKIEIEQKTYKNALRRLQKEFEIGTLEEMENLIKQFREEISQLKQKEQRALEKAKGILDGLSKDI